MGQVTAGRPALTPLSGEPARERIIRAATRLFYRQGIPRTGVDAIIDTADVAKMSLYRNFGSKDQLIVECLRRLDLRYHDWFVAQVRQRARRPQDALLSLFDVLDEWFGSDDFRGCAFINATVELADPGHPAREPAMAHKRRNREYIADLARAAGVADPASFARQLMLLVEGAIVTALVQRDPGAARDAKEAARVLMAAALPRLPGQAADTRLPGQAADRGSGARLPPLRVPCGGAPRPGNAGR
jgi:AcrR family transcriptional regulator